MCVDVEGRWKCISRRIVEVQALLSACDSNDADLPLALRQDQFAGCDQDQARRAQYTARYTSMSYALT